MHNLLKQVDPDTAFKLHPNDTRRIIRALEVYHLTGKTMKEYRQNYREMEPQNNLLLYGLTMDRQTLYRRINQRVDKMINAGLVREVISLLDRGYGKDLVSMQGLGYKDCFLFGVWLPWKKPLRFSSEIPGRFKTSVNMVQKKAGYYGWIATLSMISQRFCEWMFWMLRKLFLIGNHWCIMIIIADT